VSLLKSEYDYIVDLLKKNCAIYLEPGKEYLVELRLGTLADAEGFSSVHGLIHKIIQTEDPSLTRKVIDAMTTNETLFFRDLKPYDYLRTELLPYIFSREKQNNELNIWSAACSTGQEPYSIAMLLHQHFPLVLQHWKTHFFATDISSTCIQYARKALT